MNYLQKLLKINAKKLDFILILILSLLYKLKHTDMKIAVYKIEKVIPSNQEEVENLCDLFNTPSLKSGYVEMVSAVSHYITKSEFNKMKKVYAKFYNKETNTFIEGSLLLNERLFAEL